jgi:hypothetical protein
MHNFSRLHIFSPPQGRKLLWLDAFACNYPEGIARFSALAAPFASHIWSSIVCAEELISRAFRIIMRAAQIETGQPPQNNIQPPALCLAAKQAKLVLDFYCCRMITEKKKGAIGTFLVSSRDNPFFSFTRRAGIIYFAPECCIIMYASIQLSFIA